MTYTSYPWSIPLRAVWRGPRTSRTSQQHLNSLTVNELAIPTNRLVTLE